MITLQIGICTDEKNKLEKTPTIQYEYEGVIKEPSSVVDPIILIEAPLKQISRMNYCRIPEFNRWYFITNIKSATNTTCTIHCHADVLYSNLEELLNCSGYVERNEDIVSPMLSDNEKPRQVNPALATIPFDMPTETAGYTYCLITTKSV